ncbi:MAG TPA: phospholipase D family protein [Candidatus Paceibacterota bacterium]|nr:phospholipase D family protein [Candidatus Paceibacterota bacterium]
MKVLSLLRVLCVVLLTAFAGCTVIPNTSARIPSAAIPASPSTALSQIARASVQPDETGFRLMPTADVALDARTQLITRAQKSIDVQYYEIHKDSTGRFFLRLLRDAAARGVRVRLLLDDLHTAGEDEFLLAFAAHENLEVRLFNPFLSFRGSLGAKYVEAFFDFKRLNRRMHNKLLIVDGIMAVTGGRNIGDEYFQSDDTANFLDLDTLVCGELSAGLSRVFDEYWNSDSAVPLAQVVRTALAPQHLREAFEKETVDATAPIQSPIPEQDVLGHPPLYDQFTLGKLDLVRAQAIAYADAPDKIRRPTSANLGAPDIRLDAALLHVRERVRAAKRSVLETTPYLVPGTEGLESMRLVRQRDVPFTIVTNSLASLDEGSVFPGYRKYRKRMVDLGVQIYELSPRRVAQDQRRFGVFGRSSARLHGKTAVIDGETVFVGSVNFDPRSEKYNTEMAVFIESRELAQELTQLIGNLKISSYRVRLSPQDSNQIEWVTEDAGGEHVVGSEPEVSAWREFILELLNVFAPEDLL